MTNVRRIIAIFMVLPIICSLFAIVFAIEDTSAENVNTQSEVNFYAYAKAPEGLYVFRYHGTAPYSNIEIDITDCVYGRLYVYNSAEDSLITVLEQSITVYACTKTALYYVTEEQKVYKTDYAGVNHEYLYQCTQGKINILKCYWDTLYFVEDNTRIKHLDVASKTVQEIWEHEYLDWVLMLNDTQLIATTTQEEDYLCDIPSHTATYISSIEANSRVTAAVKGTTSNNARTTTGDYFADKVTQENDVSFPIEPYSATRDYNIKDSSPQYSEPSSWFHTDPEHEGCYNEDDIDEDGTIINYSNCKWYGGSWECEGFARYVHDVYAHMDDTYIDFNADGNEDANEREAADIAWESRACMVTYDPLYRASDDDSGALKLWPNDGDADTSNDHVEDRIRGFFRDLKTGAYIRYGKYEDEDGTPWNGCHSVVFIAKDDDGVWVYECNQTYKASTDLQGKDKSYYGCGVFIQYFLYEQLFKYKFVLHYANHTFVEALDYHDKNYHKKGCTNCGAYVLQEHTDVQAVYVNASRHSAEFRCCDEGNIRTVTHNDVHKVFVNRTSHRTEYRCCDHDSAATDHTGTIVYKSISSSKHRVGFSCCEGSVTEVHMYENIGNDQQECILCGYIYSNLLGIEDEEVA